MLSSVMQHALTCDAFGQETANQLGTWYIETVSNLCDELNTWILGTYCFMACYSGYPSLDIITYTDQIRMTLLWCVWVQKNIPTLFVQRCVFNFWLSDQQRLCLCPCNWSKEYILLSLIVSDLKSLSTHRAAWSMIKIIYRFIYSSIARKVD
jgi:hypothetical protein